MADQNFPLIAIGASAGGIEACRELVREIPANKGWAIVIVTHLRRHETLMPEMLTRVASMQVQLITEGMGVERNIIYVIPPNCDLTLSDSAFHLDSVSKPFGWPNTITVFFDSLAKNWSGPRAVVILSGLDSDGATALQAIKAAGGTTFVQKLETAAFPDMPKSALKTGHVDFELSPEGIAQQLALIYS